MHDGSVVVLDDIVSIDLVELGTVRGVDVVPVDADVIVTVGSHLFMPHAQAVADLVHRDSELFATQRSLAMFCRFPHDFYRAMHIRQSAVLPGLSQTICPSVCNADVGNIDRVNCKLFTRIISLVLPPIKFLKICTLSLRFTLTFRQILYISGHTCGGYCFD